MNYWLERFVIRKSSFRTGRDLRAQSNPFILQVREELARQEEQFTYSDGSHGKGSAW